jgi:WD40 repeat protein
VTEDDFPEVKVDFQETFLGHNSSISCCRFSASGSNVASSSVDGTVRIWTYDSSTPSSKNATIYCGSEVSALSWECRSDRLVCDVYIGFFLLYHFLQHLTFEKTYLRHFILSPISLDNSCS